MSNDDLVFIRFFELGDFGSIRRGEWTVTDDSLQTALCQSEDCIMLGPSLKT